MINLLASNPIAFFITAVLLLLAITVHEFFHAYAADRLGDPTPRMAGRLTIDPRAHLDPIGTLLLLFVGFGWGKPVPFDPFNLKNHKRDSALISIAGPLSNFGMAIGAGIVYRALDAIPILFPSFIGDTLTLFTYYNLLLGLFNLLPIHPLDGFKAVGGLLPDKYYHDWMELRRYGMIFLILLILPFFGQSPVFTIISPIIRFFMSILIPESNTGII